MEIIFNKLYKIDITANEVTESPEFQKLENFARYIQGLLEQITTKSPDRYYRFESEHTEIHSLIKNILQKNEYENTSRAIASRLLGKEKETQNDLEKKNLNTKVQRGMLIVSLVKMTDDARKLMIIKVDYDEFLSEVTGEIATGLSLRKKIYKAFIGEINNQNEIISISVFDTNTYVSAYWWKSFLELEVVTTNEENTKNAFNGIEKEILIPIKKNHKQDYLLLWNTTVAYFRSDGEFNLQNYRDNIIGKYTPYDNTLKIEELESKIDKLPEKYKFDQRFEKVPSKIYKHFKNVLTLTNEIDLIIKHDVANFEKVFKAKEDADGKYIMIRSDKGFEYVNAKEQEKLK
jgi:hypothetical protein